MAFVIISILILIIISLLYFVSFYLSPSAQYYEKLSPYESGFEPSTSARIKFEILYWLIAILYLIFDLEIILLFPFGLTLFLFNSYLSYLLLYFFLFILTLAFVYEFKFNALLIK